MNHITILKKNSINSQIGLSIDCRTGKILVDLDSICKAHGKSFEQICKDEGLINMILDTYADMKRVFTLKAPF